MTAPLHVTFSAGQAGPWLIRDMVAVCGAALPAAPRLAVTEAPHSPAPGAAWALRGTTSNLRYTRATERQALAERQQGLARPEASQAVLIPIRKTAAWWALAQDERRSIMEEQSRHIAIGMEYLPAIARRLHHSRDLGEPFDFLTWFEFAPAHAQAFRDMLARLRDSAEWQHVEHEVEVWLERA